MGLKPTYDEGFVNPEPADNVLLKVSKVEFKNNDKGDLVCLAQYEIVECKEAPDNVGKKVGGYFGLHEINGKFFGAENFLGLIHKATGKELDVDIEFFEDVKNQSKIDKQLSDQLFGGDILHRADKNDASKVYAEVKRYRSKEEYKEIAKNSKGKDTANSTDAEASDPKATGGKEPAEDGW